MSKSCLHFVGRMLLALMLLKKAHGLNWICGRSALHGFKTRTCSGISRHGIKVSKFFRTQKLIYFFACWLRRRVASDRPYLLTSSATSQCNACAQAVKIVFFSVSSNIDAVAYALTNGFQTSSHLLAILLYLHAGHAPGMSNTSVKNTEYKRIYFFRKT